MLSDGELLRRFLEGDESAFETLVMRHERAVRKLALGLLRDPGLAEDVAQEAFLRAFRNARNLERPEAFRPWLYRIAVNRARDTLRQHARRREVALEEMDREAEPPGGKVSLDERLGARELRQLVAEALANMREEHRAPFLLREIEGLSYKEIAQALGWPLGTVQARVHRARQELRVLLESNRENRGGE